MSTTSEAPVRWLTADEERAWRGYRRMRTLLDLQLARDLARDYRLSEADYDVMSTMSERADTRWRVGDLAQRLLWSTSRLTHHIKRMEARRLVQRQACDHDARGAIVTLTDVGWSTLRGAAPLHVQSVRDHLIDLLAPEEIDSLTAISEKVIGRLTGAADGDA
jgi:DNA-binding MarR family transcriptional regulator